MKKNRKEKNNLIPSLFIGALVFTLLFCCAECTQVFALQTEEPECNSLFNAAMLINFDDIDDVLSDIYNFYGVVRTPSKVTIDGVRYTTIKEKGGNLYPGSYALASDITLTKCLEICNGDETDEPTTIILNGHTLRGMTNSDSPAIIVSEGSKLIIKDKEGAGGKIVGCYIAVSVNDGSVELENADISECSSSAIDACNAGISISGDSNITDNECGIKCGEGVSVVLSDKTNFSSNETAIQLSQDTQISLGNGISVSGNKTAGILCSENQQIGISADYDESNAFNAEISLTGAEGIRLVLPEIYKQFKNCFTGCGSTYISVLVGENSGNTATVESIGCSGHKYTYTADGNTILANCSECGFESKIVLDTDAYYDSQSSSYFVGLDNIASDIYVNTDGWDAYKVQIYPELLYTDLSSGITSSDVPTKYGTYKVKMLVLSDADDLSSKIAETTEISFTVMCSNHNWEYISENFYIYARCKNCGGVLAEASLSANNFDLTKLNGSKLELYGCRDDSFEYEINVAGNNMGLGSFAVVYGYYQEDGSIQYSFTRPEEDGNYTVKIAVLKRANNPNSAMASTDEVSFSYRYHNWNYTAETDCINAHCDKCNGSASVRIDTTELMTAARSFANGTGDGFTGNVFNETDWSSQVNIKKYHVLYKNQGADEYSSDPSVLSSSSFFCYTKIVLLDDESDPASVCLSTDEIPCYFATMDVNGKNISDREFDKKSSSKPSSALNESGQRVYYVHNASELRWTAYYVSDAIISIENDIVVNPLVVSDDGKNVYSASTTIYRWYGYGYEFVDEFQGKIYGNGHTISGLYYCTSGGTAGLISYGINFEVRDLTIKDSVLVGYYSGGIAGSVEIDNDDLNFSISECSVLNCVIGGSNSYCSGGMIGLARIKAYGCSMYLYECVSNAYITGDYSGGMIGACQWKSTTTVRTMGSLGFMPDLLYCVNLGRVYGKTSAGGMIGEIAGDSSKYYYDIWIGSCRNAGRIESPKAAGGFVGVSHHEDWVSPVSGNYMNLFLVECINIADIYSYGTWAGGLVGLSDNGMGFTSYGCSYYGASNAVGAKYVSAGNYKTYDTGTKLTAEQAKKAKLCSGLGTEFSHIAGEWTSVTCADCTNGGSKKQKCLVCGEVLDTAYYSAHGHDYVNDCCIYCGEYSENNVGSVFSEPGYMLYILTALLALSCAAVIIYKKKKDMR